ncbi:Oxaloacetate decarboxylase [Geodia barretti]|uniref:Oxaloacetate decarboxylase n=1 Tax=Geodia barretti TaxID=519541 RepID=A0AA35WT93_GEOBA|nr:Oxaloacetate decarboxylase [Geodia barretti]
MNLTARRERFRAILAGDRCVHPASVFDPMSARAAEDIGFEVGMFAGSIASGTVLGAPDLIVLTLTEFAQQIHRICRAGDISLMVDADHGYGKRSQREAHGGGTGDSRCILSDHRRHPATLGLWRRRRGVS